jgi:hypothetical protein
MDGRRRIRLISTGLICGWLALLPTTGRGQDQPGHLQGFFHHVWGNNDLETAEIVSVHQLADLIDRLDESLYHRGQVVVKGPDVWGQNRLTQYRADYEDQMRGQLSNFEIILSSYQRRADLAALTSATAVGASVAPRVTNSRNVSTSTTVSPAPAAPTIPSAAGLVGPTGLVANANSLLGGGPTALLMPSNLTALALANKGATPGIGIEPTVVLDERSRFLNHLEQLRRINVGDDRTDMPGYSLYLVRMPVSILPGAQSIKGKGAIVTVEAKHNLTPDLLANTFRNVVILDTAYQLMDAVTRGQYLPIGDLNYDLKASQIAQQPNPCLTQPDTRRNVKPQPPATRDLESRNGGTQELAGSRQAVQGSGPGSEVVKIYGEDNLRRLIAAVKQDEDSWYRHDPSVVSWLLTELASAHAYMRDNAGNADLPFDVTSFEKIRELVLARKYTDLETYRETWLKKSARSGVVRPIDVLAFALMVQSVFVDRQLKHDMKVMAERKGCVCGNPEEYFFYELQPSEPAKQAFNAYVACKWPIHVFSLDPVVEQQNQLDLFSQRTELQLALATAVATGQANIQNATTYARRLEKDLAAVNLNRVAVGFGAGETTFGWRFYPRIQTPPTESNPRRIAGILINNGPGPDYALKNLQIEPGLRECYALMVVPNFTPMIKMTTVTNWFDLKTHHPDQELETTDMVRLGRKLQTARNAMTRLCDSGRYRPTDVESLGDRLDQLDAMLPIQSHQVMLPFEADLLGSEMFSSTNAGLGPRLLTWYGEPARPGGSIFILGSGFTVHEMKVIVGGVTLKEVNPAQPPAPGATPPPTYDIISRNVLRIDIPKDAQAVDTGVLIKYPKPDQKPADPGTRTVETTKTTVEDANSWGPLPLKRGTSTKKTVETTKTKGAAPKAKGQKTQEPDAIQPPTDPECKRRKVIDVHVATPNGISNHLLVEVPPNVSVPPQPRMITTSVTTTNAVNPTTGTTTTRTEFTTTPPGVVLPPGTFLPMGGSIPPGGTFVAPGAGTFNVNPSNYQPGTVPSSVYPALPADPTSTAPNPGSGAMMQSDPLPGGEMLADRSEDAEAAPAAEGPTPPLAPLDPTTPPAPEAPLAPTVPSAPATPVNPPAPSTSAPDAGALGPLSNAAAMRRDPNVLPASVPPPQGRRRGLGLLQKFLPFRATRHETPPPGQLTPGPAARKSLLSRVLDRTR